MLIDEADKPKEETELGAFFKLLTEKLVTIECNKICLGISGLPETINKLRDSHESSLRIFHILNLKTLATEDCEKVIDLEVKEANEKNKDKISIQESAKKSITNLSEGYPYFLQQFSYNSFEESGDNVIDEENVKKGIQGALKQIGEKLFNNMFYDKIDSEEYRKVLQYMASKGDVWITRSNILKDSGIKDTTINNALKALKERDYIR